MAGRSALSGAALRSTAVLNGVAGATIIVGGTALGSVTWKYFWYSMKEKMPDDCGVKFMNGMPIVVIFVSKFENVWKNRLKQPHEIIIFFNKWCRRCRRNRKRSRSPKWRNTLKLKIKFKILICKFCYIKLYFADEMFAASKMFQIICKHDSKFKTLNLDFENVSNKSARFLKVNMIECRIRRTDRECRERVGGWVGEWVVTTKFESWIWNDRCEN